MSRTRYCKNRIRVIVFIVTFNNISVISGGHFYWWRKQEYPEKTTDLSIKTTDLPIKTTDLSIKIEYRVHYKQYHSIFFHRVRLSLTFY